jgi:hypothetical protein
MPHAATRVAAATAYYQIPILVPQVLTIAPAQETAI